jgi:hypothetical protein
MGFDLRRADDVLSLGFHTWTRAYAFAIEGGWEPKGTLPAKRFSQDVRAAWQGWYDSNDGQIITADDASNMAAALEKMVVTLPVLVPKESTPFDESSLAGGRIDPRAYFTLDDKRRVLQSLIHFLRGGACEIW